MVSSGLEDPSPGTSTELTLGVDASWTLGDDTSALQ